MTPFQHADQRVPDHGQLPPPCSWDYAPRWQWEEDGSFACQSDHDFALCTCTNRHTCRLVDTVHRVGGDGTVSPSYVCPATGCAFHEHVQLVGWDPGHVYVVKGTQ